jgi:hypothetical protein
VTQIRTGILATALIACGTVACSDDDDDETGGVSSGGSGEVSGGSTGAGGTSASGGTAGTFSTGGGPACGDPERSVHAKGLVHLTIAGDELELEDIAVLNPPIEHPRIFADTQGFAYVPSVPFGFHQAAPDGALTLFPSPDEDEDVRVVRTADLDGDEDLDVVVGALSSESTVLVVWERDGIEVTHRLSIALEAGNIEEPIFALGDVNGDDTIDIVTYELGVPIAYLGDGAFEFERTEAGPRFDELNTVPESVALADMDGDGELDLLGFHATCCDRSDPFVAFLPGDGTGTFGAAVRTDMTDFRTPVGFADVTGDGVADWVYARDTDDPEIPAQWVAAGRSDGAFEDARSVHDELWGYVFTDMTRDGVNDIVGHAPAHDLDDPRSYIVVLDVAAGGDMQAVTQTYDLPDRTYLTLAVGEPGEPFVALANFGCQAPCSDSCNGQCLLGGCVP